MTVLSAACLHELGHFAVLKAVGAQIFRIRIGILGAVMETDAGTLSYGRELAAILAGPGMNLLCAILLLRFCGERGTIAAGAHLIMCCFNLLPIRPLDGGRAVELAAAWLWGPDVGEIVARIFSILCSAFLTIFLFTVMGKTRGSLWLLPAAAGAIITAGRETRRTKS